MFEITLYLTFWPIVEKLTCQLAHVGHNKNFEFRQDEHVDVIVMFKRKDPTFVSKQSHN